MLVSEGGPRPLLLGQGTVRDRAVGEDVEVELGAAPGVRSTLTSLAAPSAAAGDYELIVTNDRAEPVRFEAEIATNAAQFRSSARLPRRNGMPLWAVTVPANGSVTLRYRLRAPGR
jgi:hypothetical protein